MSEWLTTGEMIDRLKVGEVAEAVKSRDTYQKYLSKVKRTVTGLIDLKSNEKVKLYDYMFHYEWRILPKYATFEEAKKAYEEGKEVKCTFGHFGDMGNESTETYSKSIPEAMGAISWYLIIKGKWEIIE